MGSAVFFQGGLLWRTPTDGLGAHIGGSKQYWGPKKGGGAALPAGSHKVAAQRFFAFTINVLVGLSSGCPCQGGSIWNFQVFRATRSSEAGQQAARRGLEAALGPCSHIYIYRFFLKSYGPLNTQGREERGPPRIAR